MNPRPWLSTSFWSQSFQKAQIRFSGGLRREFYDIMAATAQAGVPQIEVLKVLSLENGRRGHPVGFLADRITLQLRGDSRQHNAGSVGSALLDLVPKTEALLIISGEQAGNIEFGWLSAARHVKQTTELRSQVMAVLAKPLFYLAAFIGMLYFFSARVLPKFEENRPRGLWPADARLLGDVADNVGLIVPGLALLLFGGTMLMAWVLARWIGPRRATADRRFPVFVTVAQLQGASFMAAMAGFIQSGIAVHDALNRMQEGSSRYMAWQIGQIKQHMRAGRTPEDALLRSSLIPEQYHWIVRVYAMTEGGSSNDAYSRISDEMMRRALARLRVSVGGLLSNLMLALLAGGVLWIYFAIFAIASVGV
jgi:type II secretory pathway component PulF